MATRARKKKRSRPKARRATGLKKTTKKKAARRKSMSKKPRRKARRKNPIRSNIKRGKMPARGWTLSEARGRGFTDNQIIHGMAGKRAQAHLMFGGHRGQDPGPASGAPKVKVKARKARKVAKKTSKKATAKKKKGPYVAGGYTYSPKRARRARRAGHKVGEKYTLKGRYGFRYTPSRKAKHVRQGRLTKSGMVNPVRRSKPRKKNPPGVMPTLKSTVMNPTMWIGGAHVVLGMSAATVFPALVEQVTGRRVKNEGLPGLGMSAASSAVATFGALWLERYFWKTGRGVPKFFSGLSQNVAKGALAGTIIRALFELVPQAAEFLKLSRPRQPIYGLTAAPKGAAGIGDWMQLKGMSGMGGGLGYVDAAGVNEALIAGESFARSVNQFAGMGDMLTLSGMGGDNRIPMQNLLSGGMGYGYPGQYGAGTYDPYGVGGLGDWVEFQGGTQGEFAPAMESF